MRCTLFVFIVISKMTRIGALVTDLDNTDRETRLIALRSLDKLDPIVVAVHAGAIMRTMCDRYYQSGISLQARHLLHKLVCDHRSGVRLAATAAIVEMLGDANRRVREEAVHTMGYMDPALAVAHASAIARALDERSDSGIHPAAQRTLIHIGRDYRSDVRLAAAKPIVEMLYDSNSNVREGAMETLANMDPMVVAAHAGAIVRMLNDRSLKTNKTKDAAVHTLDKLCRDCRQAVHLAAVESIEEILGDSSWVVRQAAVLTIGKLDLVGVLAPFVGAIIRMLDDPVDRVCTEAIRALQRQPPTALSPYADNVAQKLGDTRVDVRLDAVRTLGHLEPVMLARHSDAIANMLRDPDVLVREAAMDVLGAMKSVEALAPYVGAIVKLLDDALSIRIAACDLLCRLGPVVYAPHVDAIAQKIEDPSAGMRIRVMRILGLLKPAAFAKHASAIAQILRTSGYIDERDAALDAMNAFVYNLSDMLNVTAMALDEEALCVLAAAKEGGECALVMDSDLASLVERARESIRRRSETERSSHPHTPTEEP